MRTFITQEVQRLRQEGRRGLGLYVALAARLWQLGRGVLLAHYYLRHATRRAWLLSARGRPLVRNAGHLAVGSHTRMWSGIAPTQLLVGAQGRLDIGEGCYLNGPTIVAHTQVSIGRRCYFGPLALVLDSTAFGLGTDDGAAQTTAPVIIEDDVWLATRCTVMPGVRIGQGAVVAVGAVVSHDVPPRCVVAGVPARIVKRLDAPQAAAKNTASPTLHPLPSPQMHDDMTLWQALRRLGREGAPGISFAITWPRWRMAANLWLSRWRLRRANTLAGVVLTHGGLSVENDGHLHIGHGVGIASDVYRCRLAVKRGATLEIGDGCEIHGTIIAATQHVSIGPNCRIAPFCHLMDGDFHDLQDRTADGESAPIVLEEGVRLGARTVVLKGVRIGRGATVLPASVVTKDVPPGATVGGVPARVV